MTTMQHFCVATMVSLLAEWLTSPSSPNDWPASSHLVSTYHSSSLSFFRSYSFCSSSSVKNNSFLRISSESSPSSWAVADSLLRNWPCRRRHPSPRIDKHYELVLLVSLLLIQSLALKAFRSLMTIVFLLTSTSSLLLRAPNARLASSSTWARCCFCLSY